MFWYFLAFFCQSLLLSGNLFPTSPIPLPQSLSTFLQVYIAVSYHTFLLQIEKQRHCFVNKGPSSQGYVFSSSHVWMWELDYKESWVLKNWCFWTVVLEKTLESPLDCKEIQPVHPNGDLSWVSIGRTDVEAETPVLWTPDAESWLIWKDPDAGKDWDQEEKGTTEDEMVGWYHRLDGHGFGWTLGVGDGQGGLAWCGSWVAKSQTWLSNWTELCIRNSICVRDSLVNQTDKVPGTKMSCYSLLVGKTA